MGGDPQMVIPWWKEGGVNALWVSDHPPRCMHIPKYCMLRVAKMYVYLMIIDTTQFSVDGIW